MVRSEHVWSVVQPGVSKKKKTTQQLMESSTKQMGIIVPSTRKPPKPKTWRSRHWGHSNVQEDNVM